MATTYSLDQLKSFHGESIQFFAAELMLLKEVVPLISDDRLAKAAVLLMSGGQTGAALLQLSHQIGSLTSEAVMLARSFMGKMTNFCYAGICDDREYRAFILHPIYKHYHLAGAPTMGDDLDEMDQNMELRRQKQEKLKQIPIVQEALALFSETKSNLNWTRKTMAQRIEVIEQWGKLLDVFFTINKLQYYSDASEALHGSLYGCTYDKGVFDPFFDQAKDDELEKKLFKDNTCVLLHLGMLIHEAFTLISYSCDIKEIWDHSYRNRNQALNLLFHVLEKKIGVKNNNETEH